MNHRTRKRSLSSQMSAAIKRIIAAWHSSNESHLAAGIAWYDRPGDRCWIVCRDIDYGASLHFSRVNGELCNRLDSFVTSFQLSILREAGLPEDYVNSQR